MCYVLREGESSGDQAGALAARRVTKTKGGNHSRCLNMLALRSTMAAARVSAAGRRTDCIDALREKPTLLRTALRF
jgi:hypothetical protein